MSMTPDALKFFKYAEKFGIYDEEGYLTGVKENAPPLKRKKVPLSMSYAEWKEKYLNAEKEEGLNRRQANTGIFAELKSNGMKIC